VWWHKIVCRVQRGLHLRWHGWKMSGNFIVHVLWEYGRLHKCYFALTQIDCMYHRQWQMSTWKIWHQPCVMSSIGICKKQNKHDSRDEFTGNCTATFADSTCSSVLIDFSCNCQCYRNLRLFTSVLLLFVLINMYTQSKACTKDLLKRSRHLCRFVGLVKKSMLLDQMCFCFSGCADCLWHI